MNARFISTFFFLSSLLHAQPDPVQIGGYAKYLFTSSDIPSLGLLNDHAVHARLNTKYFATENITIALEFRNRFIAGNSIEKIPNYSSLIRSTHTLGGWDVLWWESGSSLGYSEVDRLWGDIIADRWQFTVGRQRIAWGTALVWNPTDIFNPLSILDIDYEERPGVDALRAQYFIDPVSKVELAVKPGKTARGAVAAVKYLYNINGYDLHCMAGIQSQAPLFGFSWAGDIQGAGFRGEVVTRKIPVDALQVFPDLDGKWSATAALSADYTFTNTFYIHSEVLYNNRGVTRDAALSGTLMQQLDLFTPSRWSVFQEFSYEIHPLVRSSFFAIINPADHSLVAVPTATWSAMENGDISLTGILGTGDPLTEFGGQGTSILLRGKYSF